MYVNMFKCDICGQLYEAISLEHATGLVGTHKLAMRDLSLTRSEYNKEEIDICPDCYTAIKKTIDDRKKIHVSPEGDAEV